MNTFNYTLSYDIAEGNPYDTLYEVLDILKAKQITKSHYGFCSSISPVKFCDWIRNATTDGDKVVLVYPDENGEQRTHRIR